MCMSQYSRLSNSYIFNTVFYKCASQLWITPFLYFVCVCDICIKNRWTLYRGFRKIECYSAGPLASRTDHTPVKDTVFFTNFKKRLNPFQTNIHLKCAKTQVPVSQRTLLVFTRKTNRLMIFREIICIYVHFEN